MRAADQEIRAQAVLFHQEALLCARHRRGREAYWVLPGGHVEPGESLWEALARELREETGLVARTGRLWSVSEFSGPGRRVLDCAFRVEAWEGEPALGSDPDAVGPRRLEALRWVTREELPALGLRPPVLARRLAEWWDDPAAAAEYLGVERA